MANAQFPIGFQQFGRQEGSTPTAGLTTYQIDVATAPAFGFGSPVDLVGGLTGPSSPATPVLGVFYGCRYIDQTGRLIWNNFWPGAGASQLDASGNPTPATAYVCDDPAQLYVAQADAATTITQDMVGQGISFSRAARTVDFSGFAEVSLTVDGNAPFRVVALLSDFVSPSEMPNGLDNTSPGNFAIVAPNDFVRRVLAAAAA